MKNDYDELNKKYKRLQDIYNSLYNSNVGITEEYTKLKEDFFETSERLNFLQRRHAELVDFLFLGAAKYSDLTVQEFLNIRDFSAVDFMRKEFPGEWIKK